MNHRRKHNLGVAASLFNLETRRIFSEQGIPLVIILRALAAHPRVDGHPSLIVCIDLSLAGLIVDVRIVEPETAFRIIRQVTVLILLIDYLRI